MTKSPRLSQTSIHKFFGSLPDPRRRRTRVKHPLLNLVVIALCGTIAGADDWEEIVQFAVIVENGFPAFWTCPRASLRMTHLGVCSRHWIR